MLCRCLQRWNWSGRICAQRRHDLCCSKAGQHQIPLSRGRDRLHSCEIRRSSQSQLWKVSISQPWKSEQKPQSQRQPQSQQFPRPWQRITTLLATPQPFSFPFLNQLLFFPTWCYTLLFLPPRFQMSALIFNFCVLCPSVVVDGWSAALSSHLFYSLNLSFAFTPHPPFCPQLLEYKNLCCVLQKC